MSTIALDRGFNRLEMEERVRSFKDDNRGAIMVLGIFFACMMIGWMWMLVGLGDAMIWRDRTQEAADAITYSSSAIQAKGMNLIAFVNVMMLLIVGVYLVMALVYNMLDLLHVILGQSGDDSWWELQDSCGIRRDEAWIVSGALDLVGFPELGAPLGEMASQWCRWADIITGLHTRAHDALAWYEQNVMTRFLPPMSRFEDVVAYGSPWAGAAVGTYIGMKYKDWNTSRLGVPIGATLFPATRHPGVAGTLFQFAPKFKAEDDGSCEHAANANSCQRFAGGDKREGLPVEIPDDGMSALCKAAATTVLAPVEEFFNGIPIVGTLVSMLLDGLADAMEDDYCHMDSSGLFGTWDDILSGALHASDWAGDSAGGPSPDHDIYRIHMGNGDDFWQDPDHVGGPHTVVGYAGNGNDFMQTWSFIFSKDRPEQSEKKVGVAGMNSTGGGGTWSKLIPQNSDTQFSLFMAQSEFYFDCERAWSDNECNGGNNAGALASYKMNWRARLRRVHGLSFTQDLFNYLWGGFLNSGFDADALQFITGGEDGPVKTIGQQFQGWLGQTLTTGAYGALKDFTGGQLAGMINPATSLPNTIH